MNLLALKHISQLAKTFQVKVMITEIGVKQNDSASAQVLADFINKARDMDLALVYGTGNRNVTNGTDMIWEPLTKTENPQPL